MEKDITMDYDKLLKLIHKLPKKDFEKLAITLSSELNAAKQATKEKLQNLILKAPTWDDQQLQEYQKARESLISKSTISDTI